MIPGDFDFRPRNTSPPLDGYVSQVWYARGVAEYRRERILPSSGAVLLVVLGPPLRMTEPMSGATPAERCGVQLSGPHDGPILNEPTGETFVVGATFVAGGIGAFVPGTAEAVTNRICPPSEVESSIPSTSDFVEGIRTAGTPDRMLSVLETRLRDVASPPPEYERWRTPIVALTGRGTSAISEVQEAMGVSRRHFASQILKRTGFRPKALQRIARMRRLLAEIDARKPIRWTAEAYGAGYFDQSHAIRDFKAFTGLTPTEYVTRRREAWGHDLEPGEASNFVPETIR